MERKKEVSEGQARAVGHQLGIDWSKVDLKEFHSGLTVELEHGAHDPETDVTGDDMLLTGKIAWAHLKEFPDYYSRLEQLESEADSYWAARRSSTST
jgi:hypothetical protein